MSQNEDNSIVSPMLTEAQLEEYKDILPSLKSLTLTSRQLCDLELILNGGFSPLTGFMAKADYQSVIEGMQLAKGTPWPMPITLDITPEFAESITENEEIALRDSEGLLIAILQISEIWQPNKMTESLSVFGSDDPLHPGVNTLFHHTKEIYIGGHLFGVVLPHHYDFRHLRRTPTEVRTLFTKMGWEKVVGFQTRNPMHRAHQELTLRAAKLCNAKLFINPSVGMTKPGDIDHYTRVRCYEKLLKRYPNESRLLSLLPLAMRMAGPKEALWHAIIRKNYGCTHFIVGRDHAGPGKNSQGKPFYEPYEAQDLVKRFEDKIGIKMVPFQEMVYVANKKQYQPINEVSDGDEILKISGTEFRHRLAEDLEIPQWFSYPDIIEELRKTYPARQKQGLTLFFTGLSGAGKSTLANALLMKLMEIGGRSVTLLDGDHIRQTLSSELGFSKADRDLNILRIGYVASEITKHCGIAICAPIAPYHSVRQQVRELVSKMGGFIEVYLSTPLEVCEQRDRKGLYAKARAGEIKGFTGIDDPYEIPEQPEVVIDTSRSTPNEGVKLILSKLIELGYIGDSSDEPST